ncbi:MAG: hypothetical protein V3V75_05865 [Thermoguttaceae bacterium]
MQDSHWQDELTPVLRQLQIITGALVAGCLFFMVIALVFTGGQFQATDFPILSYTAAGFAFVTLILRIVVPGFIVGNGRRRIARGTFQMSISGLSPNLIGSFERTGDAGKLWMVLYTSTIVSAASLEGAAFFALIAYLADQSPLSFMIAIALIVGVILHIPSRSRIIHWTEDQLTQLEQERQLGDYKTSFDH